MKITLPGITYDYYLEPKAFSVKTGKETKGRFIFKATFPLQAETQLNSEALRETKEKLRETWQECEDQLLQHVKWAKATS